MKMVRKASLHSALERERSAEPGGGPRCSSPNDTYVSGSLWSGSDRLHQPVTLSLRGFLLFFCYLSVVLLLV